MNIIKLSAINSTNDYLKQMSADLNVDNFTIVTTDNQTAERGQMGSTWVSEPGKNLSFSVLLKDVLQKSDDIFTLNVCVAISIIDALDACCIEDTFIKWPNDILAGNRKIGGILIENSFKENGAIQSVIGIGMNINQHNFEGLNKAGSLLTVTGKEFDKGSIMMGILEAIKHNLTYITTNPDLLWERYHTCLYKKNIPTTFEKDNQKFMGIIKGVCHNGKLQLMLEDDCMYSYGIKEIKMLY